MSRDISERVAADLDDEARFAEAAAVYRHLLRAPLDIASRARVAAALDDVAARAR